MPSRSVIGILALYSLGLQDAGAVYKILVHALAIDHRVNAEFSTGIPREAAGADSARNRRTGRRGRWRGGVFGGFLAIFLRCCADDLGAFMLAVALRSRLDRTIVPFGIGRGKSLLERFLNRLAGGAWAAAILDLAVCIEAFVGLRCCLRCSGQKHEGDDGAECFHGGFEHCGFMQ